MSCTSLLCVSVCALAGGALLQSMCAASGEVALASYQSPPGAMGGNNSPQFYRIGDLEP